MSSSKNTVDPLRAKLNDLLEDVNGRLSNLRDYAAVPENMWLARGELDNLSRLLGELESQLDEIRQQDAENGY